MFIRGLVCLERVVYDVRNEANWRESLVSISPGLIESVVVMWTCPSLATGFTPQHTGPIDLYRPDTIIISDLFPKTSQFVPANVKDSIILSLTWVQILGVFKTSFTIFGNMVLNRCCTSSFSIPCKREIKMFFAH